MTRCGVAAAPTRTAEAKNAAAPVQRRLRIAVVGLGGRGSWIAGLFQQHPGYEIVAAVDYFEDTANAVGDKLGVPAGNRFSSLRWDKTSTHRRCPPTATSSITRRGHRNGAVSGE